MSSNAESFGLSSDQLTALFPFHFVINRQFKLVQIGPSLSDKFDQEITLNSHIDSFFELNGPSSLLSWSHLKSLKHNTCTLKHKKSLVNFSAKVLPSGSDNLIFIIKPLISTDIYFNKLGLSTTDFIHHDIVNELFQKNQEHKLTSSNNTNDLAEALAVQTLQLSEIRLLLANQETESHKLTHIISRNKHWIVVADVRGNIEWANSSFNALNFLDESVNLASILELSPDQFSEMKASLISNGIYHKELLFNTNDVEKYIDFEVQALLDDANNILNIITIGRDTTEQRKAALVNNQLSTELNTIFDLSPDGFVSFNSNGILRHFNTAFLSMTGLKKSDLNNINPQQLELLINKLDQSQDNLDMGGNQNSRILKIDKPKLTFIRLSTRNVINQNTAYGSLIYYFQDITHEYELSKMKGEFLSMAAHELRTPMASIYGFTDLLINREYSTLQTKEILQNIFRQSVRMTNLINDLLDLARIESRVKRSLKTENIVIKKLIDTTVVDFSPSSEGRKILIEDFNDALAIKGNLDQLSQVLTNLLSNAHKYSPIEQEITIQVIENKGDNACFIGICIVDNGVGILHNELSKVFEPFFRSANTSEVSGTGLGMKIAKEIIELHDGKIELESKSGLGTKVTVWLPK